MEETVGVSADRATSELPDLVALVASRVDRVVPDGAPSPRQPPGRARPLRVARRGARASLQPGVSPVRLALRAARQSSLRAKLRGGFS